MNKRVKFSLTGIFLSLLCIGIALKVNYGIAIEYFTLDGKSQAFVGLRHLDRLYYCGIGVLGFIVALIGRKLKEKLIFIAMALLLSVLSIVITFLDSWRWMI